jgi:hypothetical protein
MPMRSSPKRRRFNRHIRRLLCGCILAAGAIYIILDELTRLCYA